MDELALLKDFRLEDASPNGAREHARAAMRVAIERRRSPSRRTLVLLGFVGAAILAGAAYAVVHELTVGDPAPEEVREQPARFGHSAELIPVPHPDDPQLDQARVAGVLDSSAGTVYLFASPNARGLCASTWIEGDRGYQGRLNMPSVCGFRDQSFFGYGNEDYGIVAGHDLGKSPLRLFWGRAGDGVARVALRFGRRTVTVPLVGRWLFAEIPSIPDEFLSYDAGGRVLERHRLYWPTGHEPEYKPPHRVTEEHQVARIRARGGSEEVTLFVARASDGGFCQIVRSDRTPTNQGCSVARPAARKIGVSAMNFGGGAPDGILLLVGPVGSDIAKLELRYQNGRVANIPLSEGWALYEIETADYAEGRRPDVLIGRDTSGREIASERMPWATPGG
jgi:hypothetical protein